jgi:hypothetical protein
VAFLAAWAWAFWPLRDTPSDERVARFVEESHPTLDDRLVSAVDLMKALEAQGSARSAFAEPMLRDAARSVSEVDPQLVVSSRRLRRTTWNAAAAALLLAIVAVTTRDGVLRSIDSLAFSLFPSRYQLEVTPGDTHVPAGSELTVDARLVGSRAPVDAEFQTAQDDDWAPTPMAVREPGAFRMVVRPVAASFRYRVKAGSLISPVYNVTVGRPPRVTRIDLEYTFPKALGLPARTEEDGGDIYAPAGTDVRLRVHTEPEAAGGQIRLADGQAVPLTADGTALLTGKLTIVEDSSYRVALAGRDGIENRGEVEYFIRRLDDRPPEVHVTRPARDRSVTPLEEVDIEARADDDFGIERLDLVYAVGGGREQVAPLGIPRRATSVTGKHTLPLEELGVAPGDFITYYVRARDVARGKRSSEVRSDIFFLEVKPFDQGVALAENGSGSGESGNQQLDELVAAQKDVIVATWKLDRRAQASGGARSEDDIRSVARAEDALKTRVERTSSSFRESQMRDPRQGPSRGGRSSSPGAPRAGQTTAEEDTMTAAATAMGQAVTSLDELNTSRALPPEMEALTHLLKARAEVSKGRTASQEAVNGSGSNRSNMDLSSRFDRELQRQQQTNYETRNAAEQPSGDSALERIKELARRQDELNQRQENLARDKGQLGPEEIKRQLETLAREQMELRQRAEELAREMSQQPQQNASTAPGQASAQGSQSSQGSRGSSGQQGGQPAQPGAASGQQLRAASETMRSAANDLRKEDPGQAAARGAQAADQLRELERRLEAQGPDEQRRALGDLQLEARQLAEAERQMAAELQKTPAGETGADAMRRLAGEQERFAARAGRVQEGLKQQMNAAAAAGQQPSGTNEQTVAAAARAFDEKRVPDRLRQSAERLRRAAQPAGSNPGAANGPAEQEIARDLERLADQLAAATGAQDEESQKLADQRARAEQLQRKIDELTGAVEKIEKTPQTDRSRASAELAELREAYRQQLQQANELLEQMRRDTPGSVPGGIGFTFEGQGMVMSAPGTEAFKQDFARWQQLRQQATLALASAAASIAKRQLAKEARDQFASGVDDKAPAAYEPQVDAYFKALATKKKQ